MRFFSSESPRGARRVRARGFTLVELMVIVLLMGILAAMGISSFREHQRRVLNVQSLAHMRTIVAAQEAYRSTRGQYFAFHTSDTTFEPTIPPGQVVKVDLNSGNWAVLAPALTEPVSHRFNIRAGLPGDTMPALSAPSLSTPTWPTNIADPWYVIQALGDSDGDGDQHYALMTSFTDTVYQEGLAE